MAQQVIGLGTTPNDGTGDSLRVAGEKINDNFAELYAAVGISIILWDFSAHASAYPTNPNALYIVTDSSVLPENTWMVANTPTPSTAGDFQFK